MTHSERIGSHHISRSEHIKNLYNEYPGEIERYKQDVDEIIDSLTNEDITPVSNDYTWTVDENENKYILNKPYEAQWVIQEDFIKSINLKSFFETDKVKNVLKRWGQKKDELTVNAMNYAIKKRILQIYP